MPRGRASEDAPRSTRRGGGDGEGARGDGTDATRTSEDAGASDEERLHHTLTLAQGRALRRELSRHTLHALGGERVCESSPDTTLGTSEAETVTTEQVVTVSTAESAGADGPKQKSDLLKELLAESDKLVLEVAKLIREDFLAQNGFSEWDRSLS